ncbi:MAG: helix-turn-helix transcriptional regulator [Clostridia bacterium]|nr:helix-turn-helix transcriptional regulator [Clostridia bacterium]
MDNATVGARIRQLREERKMNRNELANKAGVSPTYIYQLEKGEKSPTVEYLGYICDALSVSLHEFFSANTNGADGKIDFSLATLTQEQKNFLELFLNSLKPY